MRHRSAGVDGYQIAQQLRQREDGGKIFLIALSGYGQDEDKRRAQATGFNLLKPIPDKAAKNDQKQNRNWRIADARVSREGDFTAIV